MVCPKCAAEVPDGFNFCESCGTKLAGEAELPVEPGGCACGAGPNAVDPQGYCTGCGKRQVLEARQHLEIVLSPELAGVTDIGRRHSTNQDDLAIAAVDTEAGPVVIIVVCDGVSSAQNAEEASAIAAKTACDLLQEAARQQADDLQAAMSGAVRAAHQAVCGLPYLAGTPKDPPAATIVAAIVRSGTATIGWMGDSRAYWFGAEHRAQLTRDHSWVNEMVDAGAMTEAEALASPLAHAITRCLGIMEGESPVTEPEVGLLEFVLNGPGSLLLCTDGLWNYAPDTEQVGALLPAANETEERVAVAHRLIDFANQQGGRDNITAAIYRI